jgi:hypothetical protein
MSTAATSSSSPWYPALCQKGIQCLAPVALSAALNFGAEPGEAEGHFHDDLYARIDRVQAGSICFTVQYCRSCNREGTRAAVSRLSFTVNEAVFRAYGNDRAPFFHALTLALVSIPPELTALVTSYICWEELALNKLLTLFRSVTAVCGHPAKGAELTSKALTVGALSFTEGVSKTRRGIAQVAGAAQAFALLRRGQLLAGKTHSIFSDLLYAISLLPFTAAATQAK